MAGREPLYELAVVLTRPIASLSDQHAGPPANRAHTIAETNTCGCCEGDRHQHISEQSQFIKTQDADKPSARPEMQRPPCHCQAIGFVGPAGETVRNNVRAKRDRECHKEGYPEVPGPQQRSDLAARRVGICVGMFDPYDDLHGDDQNAKRGNYGADYGDHRGGHKPERLRKRFRHTEQDRDASHHPKETTKSKLKSWPVSHCNHQRRSRKQGDPSPVKRLYT